MKLSCCGYFLLNGISTGRLPQPIAVISTALWDFRPGFYGSSSPRRGEHPGNFSVIFPRDAPSGQVPSASNPGSPWHHILHLSSGDGELVSEVGLKRYSKFNSSHVIRSNVNMSFEKKIKVFKYKWKLSKLQHLFFLKTNWTPTTPITATAGLYQALQLLSAHRRWDGKYLTRYTTILLKHRWYLVVCMIYVCIHIYISYVCIEIC